MLKKPFKVVYAGFNPLVGSVSGSHVKNNFHLKDRLTELQLNCKANDKFFLCEIIVHKCTRS